MKTTYALIGINVLFFVFQIIIPGFSQTLWLQPVDAMGGSYWQFFTYMFLHGDILHITFNMFVLFMFGVVIEHALGWRKYVFLYIASGVGSAVFYIILIGIENIPMLGASGAVFGILTAYGFMFPKEVVFIPPGIPLPAIFAVILLAGMELFLGVTGLAPGIANFGHLGGILTAIPVLLYWKHRPRFRTAEDRRNYEFFFE